MEQNSKRQKEVILLMITNGEGWHFLSAKKLSALSRGMTPKHDRDFYFFDCLHLCGTKNKLESYDKHVKINIFVTLQCLLKT